jgi:hypothetical protein
MVLVAATAGTRATAAEFDEAQNVTGIIKPADESVTSSVALQNDNDLVMAAVASATYQFDCFLYYEGFTQGSSDIKWTWAIPAGATMVYGVVFVGAGGGLTLSGDVATDVVTAGTNGAGNIRSILMTGSIVMSSTAGPIQLKWAQNTSSGTATIVHAGSTLTLKRMS